MNSQELRALQESYGQVYELDEVSSADYTALAKTKKPRSKESIQARYHAKRLSKPEPETGKKSPRPYYPGGRKGMTQKDRDWSRGADEYGHSGYDGEGGGGSLPKGKKLERQKKTGVSAESFDLYDIILSHLLDEGYADTEESADKIILNMSESWFEDIMERRENDEPGEEDSRSDVRSHNRAVGYKSKPKQKYGSYDKRDRGGSEEDHEKALALQNSIRSIQGGSK